MMTPWWFTPLVGFGGVLVGAALSFFASWKVAVRQADHEDRRQRRNIYAAFIHAVHSVRYIKYRFDVIASMNGEDSKREDGGRRAADGHRSDDDGNTWAKALLESFNLVDEVARQFYTMTLDSRQSVVDQAQRVFEAVYRCQAAILSGDSDAVATADAALNSELARFVVIARADIGAEDAFRVADVEQRLRDAALAAE